MMLVWFVSSSVQAFTIPLPGGGKISMDQGGILRINLQDTSKLPQDIPSSGTSPSSSTRDSIEIRDTGTIKGYGAFCIHNDIPKHTFLGFYEGALISSREELEELYPTKSMDYVMSLDGGMTFLDGYERAQQDKETGRFSPVFLNHADKDQSECNCIRLLEDQQVAFFTARTIHVGEELCFDYGKDYWKGNSKNKM
mmetsp:Transcript_11921/g.14414  ORF Transcript_11921/g.14414 Transcript_11921/m.14414 type:complete len:196 (-) Transcript_11921:40-627(-)